MILKKVSLGNFRIILISQEEKNSTIESKDKILLFLNKFSCYLVIVKIIKIRRLKGHISQKNHDSEIVLMQKQTLHCFYQIHIFLLGHLLSSFFHAFMVAFLRKTLYLSRKYKRQTPPPRSPHPHPRPPVPGIALATCFPTRRTSSVFWPTIRGPKATSPKCSLCGREAWISTTSPPQRPRRRRRRRQRQRRRRAESGDQEAEVCRR